MLVAGTESWPALRPYEVRCSKEAKESFLELKLHFYIGECHMFVKLNDELKSSDVK